MSETRTVPVAAERLAVDDGGDHWVCCRSTDDRTLCGEGDDDDHDVEEGDITCPACLLLASPFPLTVCPFDGGYCDRVEP